MNDLLQPLAEQIEDIANHLEETAIKSETALTLSQSTKLEMDEALQIRQKLKQTTQRLREERIMYRWSTPGKLTVRHNGKLYHAIDEDSGLSLLQDLNLLPPSEKPKRSAKRRLSMTLSPFKASKVPIRIIPNTTEQSPAEKKRDEDKTT
ncbi:UNVERIFIED_CONTAM: hypothetical protein K2H54_009966 [Gekko kuhli]